MADIGFPTTYHFGPIPPFAYRRSSPIVYAKRIPSDGSAGQNFLAALTTARDKLLAMLDRPPGEACMTTLVPCVNAYLALLRGLLSSTFGDRAVFDSPLRKKAGKIVWTNWSDGTTPATQGVEDTLYEAACVLVAGAVSLCSFGAGQAQKGDEEGVKNAFRAFAQAYSWITHVKDEMIPQIQGELPSDMQASSVAFLQAVISAHAHEIVIGRAEGAGHDNTLICKVARHASEQYSLAAGRIPAMAGKAGAKTSGNWSRYFDYKANFCQAVALHRYSLVAASDKGKKPDFGAAVKASGTAVETFERAVAMSEAYSKEAKFPNVLPQKDTSGRRLRKDADAMKRTNDIVHRARIPPEIFMPDSQATMPVTPFTMPPPHDLCNEAAVQDMIRAAGVGGAPAAVVESGSGEA